MLTIRTLPARLPPPDAIQAIIVTSANAFDGLPPSYRALPLLGVGGATAAIARQHGFVDVRSAEGNAADLASLCTAVCDPSGRMLLVAAGEGQSEPLVASLRRVGFVVEKVTLYAARPVLNLPEPAKEEWCAGTLRAALFFSAETARAFVRSVRAQGLETRAASLDALAIGPPAAAALALLPWRQVRVALRPDQDAMLALLK